MIAALPLWGHPELDGRRSAGRLNDETPFCCKDPHWEVIGPFVGEGIGLETEEQCFIGCYVKWDKHAAGCAQFKLKRRAGGIPMKITVFNGSPRGRRSNSHRIVEPFLEGCRQGGAEVEEVFLVEKNIEHCRGCFHCWTETPGVCVLKDDMTELMRVFLESDVVGMATPVYGMYMTALLKNFTDRFLPLATPHIRKNEDGTFYHDGRVSRMPQQFMIANSGFPGEHNFDLLKAVAAMQGAVLEVYRNCGEALQDMDDPQAPLYDRLVEYGQALRDAGREMAVEGQVSASTQERLNMELMSDEEYMAGANEHWDARLEGQDTDSAD